MKTPRILVLLAALAVALGSAASALAAPAGKLVKIAAQDAAWAAEARKTYPLETCVASDEPLGSMGDATEWIYRTSGQPDRLVKFCCDGCIDTFLDDPAAHLAKIDAAAQRKAAADAAKN